MLKTMTEVLKEDIQKLYNKYDKLARNIIAILAFLFIAQMGLGLWNLSLSHDNTIRTEEIQASRKNSILISCEEQNTRNENSISTLDDLLTKGNFLSHAETMQIEQTKTFTILLINALAPKQDCVQRVKKFTKP